MTVLVGALKRGGSFLERIHTSDWASLGCCCVG